MLTPLITFVPYLIHQQKHYYDNKIRRYAEKASGEMYTRLMKFKIFARMESSENTHRIILVTLNQWGEN